MFLNLNECADRLQSIGLKHVNRKTISNMIDRKQLPAKVINRKRYVLETDLERKVKSWQR